VIKVFNSINMARENLKGYYRYRNNYDTGTERVKVFLYPNLNGEREGKHWGTANL